MYSRRRRNSRYGGLGAGRTRKVRPLVSVKEKIARRGGKCNSCRQRFNVGDKVVYVRIKKRAFHASGCVPADVHSLNSVVQQNATPTLPKNAGEAKLFALVAMENALVREAEARGPAFYTPEVDKLFDRYTKLKEHALRPGSEQEARIGFERAAATLFKIVFNS